MKNLILCTLISALFLVSNSCKKKEKGFTEIKNLYVIPVNQMSATIEYFLDYSDNTEILDAGIICSVDKNSGFYGPKFRTDNTKNRGKQSLKLELKSPETVFYIQAFVVTKSDTILSEQKIFESGKFYYPGNGAIDIDGNSYSTVMLNNKEWMAENLKVKRFSNGDSIEFHDYTISTTANEPVYTYQYMDPNIYDVYGAHYNYNVVIDNRNVCPVGWHVPTFLDLEDLRSYIGNPNFNANLKAEGNSTEGNGLWDYPNAFATDVAGLGFLPAGEISQDNYNGFNEMSTMAIKNNNDHYRFILHYLDDDWELYNFNSANQYTSIRCVKD